MVGINAVKKPQRENCAPPATRLPSATTVVVEPGDDDYEDGDFATPKHDRYGNDDEPL
jgi:hypothetical protein